MRRTLLLGILLGVLISAVAGLILVSTLPSDDEIQRISLEEFGIDPNLTANPLIAGIIEQVISPVQTRVRDRVVDDVEQGVLLAALGAITVTTVGVALISADASRRKGRETT